MFTNFNIQMLTYYIGFRKNETKKKYKMDGAGHWSTRCGNSGARDSFFHFWRSKCGSSPSSMAACGGALVLNFCGGACLQCAPAVGLGLSTSPPLFFLRFPVSTTVHATGRRDALLPPPLLSPTTGSAADRLPPRSQWRSPSLLSCCKSLSLSLAKLYYR